MAGWAGLGYYARARNLVACARAMAECGEFPADRDGLRALPDIGAYTSAAIAAIAHDAPETVVDGNVERVVARLFAVVTPMQVAKRELHRLAETMTPQNRPGDFAQAMMDLRSTICTSRSPARKVKPHRHRLAGLAGRRGSAGTAPCQGFAGRHADFSDDRLGRHRSAADWQRLGEVRHVFTHFELILTVMAGHLTVPADRGDPVPLTNLNPGALPGLMRKSGSLDVNLMPSPASPPGSPVRRPNWTDGFLMLDISPDSPTI